MRRPVQGPLFALFSAGAILVACDIPTDSASSSDCPRGRPFCVDPTPPLVNNVRIELPDSVTLAVGDTVELVAVVWVKDFREVGGRKSWTVRDTTVATLGIPDRQLTGQARVSVDWRPNAVNVEATAVGRTHVIAYVSHAEKTGRWSVSDSVLVIVQ